MSILVVIVETAYILNMYEFEDVMDTYRELVIWFLVVHNMATLWEQHEDVTLRILFEERVVLVAQSSPQATESDILAPL